METRSGSSASGESGEDHARERSISPLGPSVSLGESLRRDSSPVGGTTPGFRSFSIKDPCGIEMQDGCGGDSGRCELGMFITETTLKP